MCVNLDSNYQVGSVEFRIWFLLVEKRLITSSVLPPPMYSATFGGRAGRSKGKAPKSKKSKCPTCGKKGHEAAKCPKGPSSSSSASTTTQEEGTADGAARVAKGGMGSGTTHKTSRRAKKSAARPHGGGGGSGGGSKLSLPPGFYAFGDEERVAEEGEGGGESSSGSGSGTPPPPFLFFDAGCDVGATLDTLTTMMAERKGSKKSKDVASSVSREYADALASSASNYGGCLCRQYLKPGRPWSATAPRTALIKEADPRVWFVLGLGPITLQP